MKIANFLIPSSQSPRSRDPDAGPRKTRTGMRIWFAAALALAGLPAFAQNFPATLSNTATIAPPANVTNVDTACTANNGVFNPANGTCSATDSNTLAAQSNVAVAKNGPTSVAANGAVTYTIVVSNAGPSAANGTVLTDPAVTNFTAATLSCASPVGGAVCPASPTVAQLQGAGVTIPTLPVGGSVTFTLTGTAGSGTSISNTATVAPPSGTTDPTPGNNTSTATTGVSSVTVAKSANPASGSTVVPGQTLTYTLTATVTGATTTAATVFTDTLGAGLTVGTLPAGCTAAGQVITCTLPAGSAVGTSTFVYTATVAAGATGSVSNSVTGGNGCTSAGACVTNHNVASINIAKTAVSTTGPNASGVYSVVYSVTVANTGNGTGSYGPLTDVPLFAGNLQAQGASWTTSGGAPAGGSASGAGPYTLAAANTPIAAGATHTYSVTVDYVYTNQTQASACGGPGTGLFNRVSLPAGQEAGGVGDNSACIQPPPPPAPALTVTKTATLTETGTPNGTADAGETINYSVTVRNSGNVTVNALAVTDVFNGGAPTTLTCTPASLAPNATATCTAYSHTVTQAEVDAGTALSNTATATGTTPGGGTVTGTSTTTTNVTARAPALTVTKTATLADTGTANGTADAGEVINYAVTVRNSGNVTVNAIAVTDVFNGGAPTTLTCTPTSLAPNATATCTAYSHTVTQAEVDAGTALANTATATGTAAGGGTVTANDSKSINVTAPRPELTVTKTATLTETGTPNSTADAGEVINYSVTVRNTGNVTVNALAVTDVFNGGSPTTLTCTPVSLAPTATATCTPYSHTVTQAEVDAGTALANTATATGTTPGGGTVTGTSTTTTNVTAARPELVVTKTATLSEIGTPNGTADAGETIDYSVTVRNSGNVTVNALAVTDVFNGGSPTTLTCTPASLAPNASATCTPYSHVVTQAEVDAGGVLSNTATATGTPASGGTVTASDTKSVTLTARNPAMTLAKRVLPGYADNDSSGTITIGDVLTYELTATNTGNITLNNVVVTDNKTTPSNFTCPAMAPTGASAVCTVTGTYTVTQADANNGNIVNNASATSTEITTPVTATSTTQVARRDIVAGPDAGTVSNGAAGGVAVPNVLVNDTLNGQPATTSTVTIAQVSTSDPKVTLDPATGAVNVAPGTPKGSYQVEYQICEIADPGNCTTAIVTVTVDAAPIDAVDDVVATPVNGATGGTNVVNVLVNDTLGGSTVNPADVTVTPNSNGPLTVKADGNVDVAPNTPAGTYTVTYKLCEVLNPANCDTATVTIVVSAPAITATDDPAGGTGTTPQNTPVSTNVIGNDTLNGAPIDPNLVTITVTTDPANGTTVVNSDGTITYTPRNNFSGDDVYTYTICEKLNPTNCATAKVSVTVQPNKVTANPDTAQTNQQTPVTINVIGNDTVTSAPLDPASVTIVGEPTNGTVTCAAGSCTYTPKQFFAGTDTFTYRVCDTSSPTPVCATASVTITVIANAPVLRLVKTSAVREVKVGDLVRYSVLVENVGDSPAVNATLVDIPPAGFTFVDNSLTVDDDNKNGVVISANPLRIGGIDVAIGGKATVSYFLRVGAGVGKGVHKNQVAGYDDKGTKISNDATAEVTMAGDPLLEDSLLVGTVFDDRDGDGWQDPAKASGVRVQGGFAPNAYVAGSTTVDRGEGPVAEPDASAPMLHGIALGRIDGRGSAAAPAREVVVRQTLNELAFTDDFVLTTDEGTTVRMGADGRTTVERTRGDAAKGLSGQDLQVTRQVAQGASGYVVSYTIRNNGIEERGIPGVRIASVEGLIMETDAYGRFHLEGIEGGNASRGRNFILKVDQATLPPGSVFTTENPRVRRITQGIPTRFDFGVKLPPGEVSGAKSETDVELGEVMFESGSAKVKESYAPMFAQIAGRLRDAGGGSVTVSAQAEEEALAFARARAVQAALLKQVEGDPALASKVKVDVVAGTDATLVSLDPAIRLGEVLFDTDQATIKPQYRALIGEIAKALNQQGSGAIGIVGRADKRGAAAYNVQLGLRRAKAVFEAISAELKPEVRQKVRVDITDDTQAPVGVGNR
ncbi:DUF7507 domain-containing protein [Lysobacter enzymogenes]|uniref:DUF11 domain-containing protein n=1 Tax=Lysobacter enzymogenes TaxID=69 RepID=A0A3N2RIS5_LYSEN|nr:Ig-like domain-containing protein [Lysobacter enzymogenes]ROU07236.1 DUF11 domain-containing protein [Lysobacter enzymogenes]